MAKLRKSGGYRSLASFQTSTLIYDATVYFCEKFVDRRSRTVDQMVQAARSGRQNIAEGSRLSGTSSQSELRLINVARSSLEELLLDYEDFLRHRKLTLWPADSAEAHQVRSVPRRFRESQISNGKARDLTELTDRERWDLYSQWLDTESSAVRANAAICLINQTNFLLDKQITALEESFINDGGYSENLAAARLKARQERRCSPENGDFQSNAAPTCSACGKLMVLRTAKQGNRVGQSFWGCSGYPDCKAVLAV